MTPSDESRPSVVDAVQVRIGRPAFAAAVAGLAAGAILFIAGADTQSQLIMSIVIALLIVLPAVNVVAVLLEEAHNGDWAFAAIAAGVLGLIVLSLTVKL